MAKFVIDEVLNQALYHIRMGTADPGGAGNAIKLIVSNAILKSAAKYASYQGASHGWNLASATLASTAIALADGDASGRKLTVAQQSNLDVVMSQTTATASEIVLTANSKVLLKTTCTAQLLTNGNTVTVPAFDDEIADPT